MNKQTGRKGAVALTAEVLAHRVIVWWLPLLYLLISSLFYLRTYDSAQVKITVMQMGGLALLVMWLARLLETGRRAFSREDLVCLAPFLAYLLVGILSFVHAPYNMASVDFFLRHFFFMTVALIVIYEFDADSSERLTRILIWTGWIAAGYGFLQLIDISWFPPGPGKGIDPFIWRGAFGSRVFSTYGNPNFFADFLVILFPILLMQYLKTKKFNYLPLMGMLLVDLVATVTKGAWLGFALTAVLFGVIAFTFFRQRVAPYRKWVLGTVVIVALVFPGFVARELGKRWVSVNFRLFTWEATWEMVRTQPLLGSGVGSFPPLYPAFRRPPIFHIEGKHNTETDHAENEHLEQIFDNGLLGFGIFVWLVLSTLVIGFRSLTQLTTSLAGKDGAPHPRAYDLVGYMVAFMGMLGHNFFDVSMRFVSSGVYLGLLSGMIVNVSRGQGLYERHVAAPEPEPAAGEPPSLWNTLSEFLLWPARLAAWGGLLYVGWKILSEFAALQGPLGRMTLGGEVLQWWLAWGTILACMAPLSWLIGRVVLLSQNALVGLLVAGSLFPLYTFWGYFKADVHHNIAIFFSKERNWDQALNHYLQVAQLNPNFVMSKYFVGNVFNDRFDMVKKYKPEWGDVNNEARDDYERALWAYNEVRRLSPNYVQMHHQVGNLHMKRAEYALQQGRPQEADYYIERAMNRFRFYEQIDPVFPPNYARMAQIYMMKGMYAEAAKTFEALIKAEKCAVDPGLSAKPWLLRSILTFQWYYNDPGAAAPAHRHESPDAYTNLANAYFMLDRLEDAERAYRKALSLDPNFAQAKQNLSVVYQKANSQGRLKAIPPPASAPALPFTGYEIVPSKK